MISQAIYGILSVDSVLSQSISTRIYPNRAVQNSAMPYIVYNIVSKVPTDTKSGGTGFDKYRVQIDIVDDSYTDVETIAARVRVCLDRQSGYIDSFYIYTMVYENETDMPPFEDEGATKIYQKSMDFLVIAR